MTGLMLGSRAFRFGRQGGLAWRATAPTVGGAVARTALLPGPAEHFPFGSGREPLPQPEFPNRVYRIMSMEEAAIALRTRRLPPGTQGTMGSKFVTLDSRYAMLFRERTLAQVGEMGEGVAAMEGNLRTLQARIAELERSGDAPRVAELRVRETNLRTQIQAQTQANMARAQTIIADWYSNPGQKVVVEIELAPGALEHMFNRSVPESLISQYGGRNVFIWKFERGYGRNIGVPEWQLGLFNDLVVGIRLYAERGVELFGPRPLPQGVQ
jgi:hypothetical protein